MRLSREERKARRAARARRSAFDRHMGNAIRLLRGAVPEVDRALDLMETATPEGRARAVGTYADVLSAGGDALDALDAATARLLDHQVDEEPEPEVASADGTTTRDGRVVVDVDFEVVG